MKTQLLLNYKPVNSNILSPYLTDIGVNQSLSFPASQENNFNFRVLDNQNKNFDISTMKFIRPKSKLISLDLFEDAEMPLNYTILDVREPDKRKTNFSKTITLPGTKNNNTIFNHVYEISGASKFNPNLRTEVVILQDGVQVMRGNMQLKNMIRFNNNEVEYEVIITGDFTSLFADIGIAKLSDLDLREYRHTWSVDNIEKSWFGTIIKDGQEVSNVDIGPQRGFVSIERQASTDRVQFSTTTVLPDPFAPAPHGLKVGDFIRVFPNRIVSSAQSDFIFGDYQVAEIINSTTFTINYPFPPGLLGNNLPGTLRKFIPQGKGYVYPMISWGDDSIQSIDGQDISRFPVTSFPMSFYVKELWDKIFEKTNSKYESEFLNSDFFKRLIITQKKATYELPTQELQSRSFKVANQIPYNVSVTGFGPDNSGNLSINSWPFNNISFPDPTFILGQQFYPFPSDIAASDGILYNGIEGERPFDQSTNTWKVTDSGKYTASFNISLQVEAICSDFRTNGTFDPPSQPSGPQGVGLFFQGSSPTGQSSFYSNNITVTVKLVRQFGGNIQILDQKINSLVRKSDNTAEDFERPDFKTFIFPTKDFVVGFEDVFLNKDDSVYVQVQFSHNINNDQFGVFTLVEYEPPIGGQQPQAEKWIRFPYRGSVNIKDIGVQYFVNKPSTNIVEDSVVFPEQFLPKDMTCKDFLIGIIRAFNLHIESDKEIEKFYKIEPRDTYYKDGSGGLSDYVDWTDKVDLESIEITPMGELTAKFYNFKYKQENDYWNKKYRDDVGQSYGDYIKEVQNDFLSNNQDISLPFGSSVMINSPRDTDIIIPQVVQKDNNGVNRITNSAAKLLFWGGLKPVSRLLNKYWQITKMMPFTLLPVDPITLIPGDLNYKYYPYAGTVDSPLDPLYDLNFYYTEYVYWNRARWSNENLFNKYWKGFLEEITDVDSKVIRARLKLSAKDIYELDFKKIYVLNGHYLRLQKIIDYNANGEDLTECEFLKLKSPSKFRRQSNFVGQSYETIIDNSRSISRIDIELPPVNFSDRNPISNWTSNDLSGQSTSTINGQNNIVSTGTNNVNISGDENYVGSSSQNITISGNGVFVTGGVKNVNIIGTDKLFVEESDVTYINGIRYKNGVAISRSNVIDAGANKVSNQSSSNTTATVIDGGEDVVINVGSSTFENVVNAGSDRILPDVSNLGISTITSANPVNNFAGEANLLQPNQTLSERIIERVNPARFVEGDNIL